MDLVTTSSTPPLASSADRELLAGASRVLKVLFVQFPQLAASSTDRRLMVSEWAQGLADMRPEEIERGLAKCRTRTFAPSLGEFATLCRPALDAETAFWEAHEGMCARHRGERGEWSHPAVWRAACELSAEVRAGAYTTSRKRWERILSREFDRGWVEDVPAVPLRLENEPTVFATPEQRERRLAAIRSILKTGVSK
jgi:hypothetical protein